MSTRAVWGMRIGGPLLWEFIDSAIESASQARSDREQLQYTKLLRDVLEKFRVYLEDPCEDIRDVLEDALRDLDDTVARAEEHIL